MIAHLSFALAVIACATAFALLEIQIEGRAGWASGLPTWRLENRLTRWFLGGRPLTGYHCYFHIFVLLILHAPYALLLVAPSWSAELRIVAFLILFWIVEDFLWFLLNPDYGIARFNERDAWWHESSWWWIMPREYWIFTPIGLGLYWASGMVG